MARRTSKLKKQMLEELKRQLGIVSVASQNTGINRDTHYEWLKTDPEYKEQVDKIQDHVIDFVENKLYKLIEQGETAATIFYLKTKAKKRGYIERPDTQVNIENKPAYNIEIVETKEVPNDK